MKLLYSNHKISYFSLLLFTFSNISCYSVVNINKNFEEQYKKEIRKIRSERELDKKLQNQIMFSRPPREEEMLNENSSYYPNFDMGNVEDKKPLLFPNRESYEQPKDLEKNNSYNMFDITYNTESHPPFRKIGGDFDSIQIPELDAYGINTKNFDKAYLLIGNSAIKESIEIIKKNRDGNENEISETLIKEKKMLKKKLDNQNLIQEILDDNKQELKIKDLEIKKSKKSKKNNIKNKKKKPAKRNTKQRKK